MTEYKNLNDNSGIVAYEINDDSIDIEFESGGVYTYTKASVGEVYFHIMIALAIAGAGLNSFINKCVRNLYTKRTPYSNPPAMPTPTVNVNLDRDTAVPVLTELLKSCSVRISLN